MSKLTALELKSMTTRSQCPIDAAIRKAPIERLREEAAYWLLSAVERVPLEDGDPEDCAMALWDMLGGVRYRGLPEWMQEAAKAAWDQMEPRPYRGRRKRGQRQYEQRKAVWEATWEHFVAGRHDT
jgi:hypothetical protein